MNLTYNAATNKVYSFLVISLLLFLNIMVNTCTDDYHGQTFNTYSRTYISKGAGKIRKPNFPSLTKFHRKLKKLAERVRSLEQPVWLLSYNSDRWQRSCEGTCFCFLEKKVISCWNNELKVIPSEQVIPFDVIKLDLGMNQLGTLHKDTFKALMKLEELDLFRNRLNYLPGTVLHGLQSLLKLKLNENRLTELPKRLFFKLHRLKSVDVSNNKLKSIPDCLFSWSSNIVAIFIYGNDITTLPAKLFRNLIHLEELDLSRNLLCSLEENMFRGLTNLKFVKLNENRIVTLPPGLFIDNKNLNILLLRKNHIIQLGSVFQNLSSLGFLDIAFNKIEKFLGDEFAAVVSLQEINLHHNSLEKLQTDVLQNATNLQKIILSSNRLTELIFGRSKLERLVYLDLQYNMLKRLDEDIFENWKFLKTLLINGNMIRNIAEENLDLLSNLNAITLANNMWQCDCSIFPLSRWLRTYKMKVLDISNVKCLEPPHMKNRFIQQIIFKDVCDTF